MILDNNTLFANGIAFGTTPTVLDLGRVTPGTGKDLVVFIQGSSNMTGTPVVTFTTGSTSACTNALCTISKTITGKTVEITLPSATEQFVKATLSGATAGTWTCGIILEPAQTNL